MENPTWNATPAAAAAVGIDAAAVSDNLRKTRNEGSDKSSAKILGHDQEDFDPAKKYRWELILGQGQRSLYEKKFPRAIIKYIARIQVGMAIGMCAVTIASMCLIRYYTSLESSGVGIWGSLFTILAARSSVGSTQKLMLRRLITTMAFHLLSIIGSLVLVILALSDSIPSQKYRLFSTDKYDIEYRGPLGVVVTSFVLTSILASAGLAQLILSIVMLSKAAQAACTRSLKLKFQVLPLDTGDVTNETKPPAYHEL